jgi:hypothetical protein
MAKFIYFQDFHYQGRNSRNRLGNYSEDLLLKFDEIISIAKDNNCEAILDGGDLTETSEPSYRVLDELADRIEKAQINLYSLLGNHSASFGHIENSRYTGLSHLQQRSSFFKYLTSIEGINYNIVGMDYYFGIENFIKEQGIQIIERIGKDCIYPQWNIVIVHALIMPNKFFDNVSHVQCKDIKTNANLILCSHWHQSFKQTINNTTFLNIGCVGRNNINEAKIEPSVLLIDTDKKSYEIIKLKSAKPANEIFNLTKYEELKQNEKSIEQFIATLNSTTCQASDLCSQVKIIGKQENIEKEVIDYGLRRINEIKLGEKNE